MVQLVRTGRPAPLALALSRLTSGGAAPSVAHAESLGGSGRGGVLRVALTGTGFPSSVIVKWFTSPAPGDGHVCGDDDRVFTARRYLAELIGAELTAAAAGAPGPYAHDDKHLLIVLHDHGRWPTLADVLNGPPAAARAATIAWARALASVHAALRGTQARAEARWRELAGGALPEREASLPCDYWRAAAADAGIGWPRNAAAELAGCYRFLTASPTWSSFCLADMCPGNALLTDGGVVFCDFEWSAPGNALLDLAALRLGFAGCQVPHWMDDGTVRDAERAYLEVYAGALGVRGGPGASARGLAMGLLRASAVRLWWDNCDQPPPLWLDPPDLARRRARLLERLRRFAGQARRLGQLPALAAVAERLITIWSPRWSRDPDLADIDLTGQSRP